MADTQTRPQIKGSVGADGRLPKPPAAALTYKTMREMRRHPTISLARRLIRAPVVASPWSVEADDGAPEGAKDFIDRQLQPLRMNLLRTAMNADIDFGWIGYEVIIDLDAISRNQGVKTLKPLLQDVTDILIDPVTGALAGLEQEVDGKKVTLTADQCILFSFDTEAGDLYGRPRLDNCLIPYKAWFVISSANDRYDKKLAGASWVVHYPPGNSMYNGVEKDNYDIAVEILAKLESSGGVVVPRQLEEQVDALNADSPRQWKLEVMSGLIGVQGSMIERQKYLDSLMSRGVGLPERAILEGQFGTKAESEAQADFAITDIELTHAYICQEVNTQLVNTLMRLNYGEQFRDTVRVVPTPLTDSKRAVLLTLYTTILSDPNMLALETEQVEMDAVRDALGIPYRPAVERQELQEVLE